MLLGARFLDGSGTVNDIDYLDRFEINQGDAATFYLQLVDVSKNKNGKPAGMRYVPATGATLQVKLLNLNSAKTYTKTATQPFPGDLSTWSFSVLATDDIRGTVNVQIILTEGSVVRKALVKSAFQVYPVEG
jgi:hypothetical protein